MRNINNKLGITLIELLVAISIIGIMALRASNFNFNKLTTKHKLDIYVNEVVSKYETIRNNALLGRGMGDDLEIPDSWKIDFSSAGKGTMKTSYKIGTDPYIEYPEYSTSFTSYSINSIDCVDIDGAEEPLSDLLTGSIIIKGSNITLEGDCPDNNSTKLKLNTSFSSFTHDIVINTVSGLIE